MHEMGIATSVFEAVDKELHSYPGERISKVGLQIGEYAGVDPESLRFCFEVIAKSSGLAPVNLEIEWCKAEDGHRGDELRIAYLELEEIAPAEEVLHEPGNR
jgi:Zn finger protein HypA/HybF involved in hydrogenase expression